MTQGIKVTALDDITQTASDDIMYVVDGTDTISKKVELQNLLYDNMITPAKLSTGAPTWTDNGQMVFDGAIYTDQIIGREDADSLILRADPESPNSDPDEGGPMIQMFSADRQDGNGNPLTPNQIYYRANFHIFQNKLGSQVAQIPSTDTPTQDNHLVRKDYVDGTYELNENGYITLPSGLIMQWGSMTPTVQETEVDLPITFPNACFNVQASIGGNFTDDSSNTSYEDNSLIWGGYPKSGDLSKIIIMSNLRVRQNAVQYKQIFWQAIGN
tara:strand:- start:997 stop:1809 length:813 start_codon:yes stop_codon:yes gene_type:complete